MKALEGVALAGGGLVVLGGLYLGVTKMAEKSAEAAQAKAEAAQAQARAEAALLEANARTRQQPAAQTQPKSGALQWLEVGTGLFNAVGGLDGISALIHD